MSKALTNSSNMREAIFWVILSSLAVVVATSIVKSLGTGISIPQILALRGIIGLLLIVCVVASRQEFSKLKPRNIKLHLARALFGLISIGCAFYAIRFMPLLQATAIGQLTPIFITILSVPILQEKVGASRWIGVFLGFIGAFFAANILEFDQITLWVNTKNIHISEFTLSFAAIIAVFGSFSLAMVRIVLRQSEGSENPISVVFWFFVISTVVTGCISIFFWKPVSMTELGLIAVVGVLMVVSQYAMIKAAHLTEASAIAPFSYFGLLWSALLDIFIWQIWPSVEVMTGALIIVVSNLYFFHREQMKKREEPLKVVDIS